MDHIVANDGFIDHHIDTKSVNFAVQIAPSYQFGFNSTPGNSFFPTAKLSSQAEFFITTSSLKASFMICVVFFLAHKATSSQMRLLSRRLIKEIGLEKV